MRRFFVGLSISTSAISAFIGATVILTNVAWTQEPVPETVSPEVIQPVERAEPVDTPPSTSVWTYERQQQNQDGTVTNTHRYRSGAEQGQIVRQHVVNSPRGEMTQTWEQSNTDDGYLYRRAQTRTGPDGAPLRQHEWTVSGTDPRNYVREHNVTLPDGRTIQQTQIRAWDGTYGTMERSFLGPNGQTHTSQHNWTPAGSRVEASQTRTAAIDSPAMSPATAQPASEPAKKARWWNTLNPFRSRSSETAQSGATAGARRGFTIGTPGINANRAAVSRSGDQPSAHASIQASQNTHRPSWAGGPPRSVRSQTSAAHSQSSAMAAQPKPGRGRNR